MGKTTTDMQLVPIGKLVPYANNARTHSPEQVTKLRSSLREFGFINPVIIDRDYGIIAGHGRVLAAKAEEMLRVEIEALQGMDFNLDLTGFDEAEIANLFAVDDGEAKEDDFDVDAELEKPCISKAGDIWHLGKHRVICGDSTLQETYQRL